MQILTPGVEHGEEADGGSQMLGVAGDGQQGLGGSSEQDAIDDFGVVKADGGDLLGHGEDDVEVGNGEQLGGARLEPFEARRGLALGTVAIAAGRYCMCS